MHYRWSSPRQNLNPFLKVFQWKILNHLCFTPILIWDSLSILDSISALFICSCCTAEQTFQHMYFSPEYLPWLVVSFCDLLCKLLLPQNERLSELSSLTDGSWYSNTLAPYSPDGELRSMCFTLASRFLPAGLSSSNQHCKLAWKWMPYWLPSFPSLTF